MRMKLTSHMFPDYLDVEDKHWTNHCGHKHSEFLGSILIRLNGAKDLKLSPVDVYVHEGDLGNADVCIRYGEAGNEYISAGSVMDFLVMASKRNDYYPEVAGLILKKLDFFCEVKAVPD